MIEDLLGVVLGTTMRAWIRVPAHLFPHYFLCRIGIEIMRRMNHENNWIVATMLQWQ
jgi:hypothetical protein